MEANLVRNDDVEEKYDETLELAKYEIQKLFEDCVLHPLKKLLVSVKEMLAVTNKSSNIEIKQQNELKYLSETMKLIKNSEYDLETFDEQIDAYHKSIEAEKLKPEKEINIQPEPTFESISQFLSSPESNIPDPNQCIVDIKPLGYARISQKIKIVSKNSNGNSIHFGGHTFTVHSQKVGSPLVESLLVLDENNGNYFFQFKPQEAGEYKIVVYLVRNDVNYKLKGSPFKIQILDTQVKIEKSNNSNMK